jgi:hypothetical protein
VIETAVCSPLVDAALAALAGDTYKVALIRQGAKGTYGPETANYAELGIDEVQGAGYVPGGQVLKGARVVERDGRCCLTFDDAQWPNADIVAVGALIYSTTRKGAAACVLNFGGTYAAVGGDTFLLPIDCPIRF